ncbi:c-type cytochrome [Methylomagnum sp.]
MKGHSLPYRPSNRVVLFALLALSPAWVSAQDFARGQELFQQHCQACHEDLHEARHRHVRTLDELRQRVQGWATHTNTGWQKGEVDDVLFYLNQSFYKFPKQRL